jgi:hypothetical protein
MPTHTPTRLARRLVAGSLILAAAACAGGQRTARAPEPATYVEVQNQSWLDQNVYVLRSSQRVRLGTVSASSTQRFRIPSGIVFGATPLRFLADPIGRTATATSMEITVSAGETVTLTIPPR